jgi:hypothetical protein
MGSRLNKKKTRIIRIWKDTFEFLGFKFWGRGEKVPQDKSVQKFKDKIRELTPRQWKGNVYALVARVNRVIIGWGNYYKNCNVSKLFRLLDSWIRERIRSSKYAGNQCGYTKSVQIRRCENIS